jgi:phosphocarrier protein HPr
MGGYFSHDIAVQDRPNDDPGGLEQAEVRPMSQGPSVARREFEIIDPDGFHMRHADEFVRLAQQYQSEVWVLHKGNPYDGKSILDLMTMAAACGSRLKLEARGPDAETAAESLADLIRSQHVGECLISA